MASDLNDEEFRNELVELFALEAEEWLQQAQTALKDLERHQGPNANPKVLDIVQQALSNLGGSAATVELPEIEQIAYEALPILETMRRTKEWASAEHLESLQQILARVADGIRDISGAPPADDEADAEEPEAPAPHVSADALRLVQQELAQAGRASRNLVDVILARSQDQANGTDLFDKAAVTRTLRELEGLDEQFLAEVQKRMPDITQAIVKLKAVGAKGTDPKKALAPAIESVRLLHASAQQAHAAAITQFLNGLDTFLGIVAERGVSLVTGRLDAVEFRLGAVVPMVQQWVEMGRIEREAIGNVLTQ